MKSMTCKQLGGACDEEFRAESFEEMAALSAQHGRGMAEKVDEAHLAAMEEMKKLMEDPEAMQKWMAEKEEAFNALEEK